MELLVVTLLRIFLDVGLIVIDTISCLFYLPSLLLLSLAYKISARYGNRKRRRDAFHRGCILKHYLLFPILYLITTFAIPSVVLYPIFAFYKTYSLYISEHSAGFWSMVISLAISFLSILAMSIRAFIRWEEKLRTRFHESDADLFGDWFEFQIRLFLHLFSILMVVNPIRFLHFLQKGYRIVTFPEFSELMVNSTIKSLLDYACLPYGFLIALTLWRVPHVWRQNEWTHKLIFKNGCYVLLEIPAFALSIPFSIIGFYRIKSFIKGFKEKPVEGFDRAIYCFEHCANVVIDIPFLLLGLILVVTIYRFIPVVQEYKNDKRTKSMRIITLEQLVCLILDLPAMLSIIILFLTRYRWSITRCMQKELLEKGNFLYFHSPCLYNFNQMILDLVHTVLCVPVFLTIWRASHLYSAVFIDVFYDEKFFLNSDSDDLDKVQVVGNEIFIQRRELIRDIFKNWIIDIAFICLGLLSLWRIPKIILHYLTIITNEEKAGSMRNKAMEEFVQSILDVLSITAMILLIIPTLYRLGLTVKRIRTEDTLYQFIIFSEAWAVLKDLPFILLGILSLWRLPVIVVKIWFLHKEEYQSAEKRRKLALEQFIDAMIDIPFVVSLILMILSIMHIFTIILLARKYRKSKKDEKELGKQRELFTFFRGKILKQLYLLPLQIPLIICTYLITFTVYRIPITVTTMKSIVGQKEPKKLAAKVIFFQALSIPLDLICIVLSAIIVLTVYRIKDLVTVLKNFPIFKSTFSIRETLDVHKQIGLVFWNLVKDIPIIILFLASSLTIWRIKHILRALANETDYKKRLLLLGTNAILTILDIPCILCSFFVLFSWRSKKIVNIISAAYVSGKLSEAHYSILLEFYELVLDIVHIILLPLLLWRIPFAIKSAWNEETAKGRRGIVIFHLLQVLLDLPYMLITLFVMMSIYRNIDIYHFLKKKKSKKTYREFIRDQALQFIIDAPIVAISLCTCVVIPYRVYFMFKYLFLYEKLKNRDEERRRELRILIAKTLVDLLTLVFGLTLLAMFWRIPFVVHRYIILKEGVRRTLWLEFKNAILDICCFIALFINLTFVYQFPYTVRRLYYFTVACFKHLISFLKTKPFSSNSATTKSTTVVQDNGEILPNDMLFEILTFLTPEETSTSFDRVCKHWHELSRQDSFLWKLYLDIDKSKNLIENNLQKKHNNDYAYNYNYQNNINLNEAYYNAIGSYRNEDFTSVFTKAFSSECVNRNEYIKRYLDIKSRYSYNQYTFEDAVNDDYRYGFHHIVKAETGHVLSHIYKLLFIRYKLLGLALYPFYYVANFFKHTHRHNQDMTWDSMELLALQLPYNIFIASVILTSKLFNIIDLFPFLGFRWWGNYPQFELWNHNSYHGKKYLLAVFLGLASVLSSFGIILYGFAVAFSPFYFDVRLFVCNVIMSIGKVEIFTSMLTNGAYDISPTLYYIFILHIFTLRAQDFIIGWVFWLLSFLLLAESGILYWINILLFIVLWGYITFYYCLFSLEEAQVGRTYFHSSSGLEILMNIYVGILKSCARQCKRMGILGQLILMPVTLAWIGWPLVIAYYYMYIYTVIPALVATGFLSVIGYDSLKHLN